MIRRTKPEAVRRTCVTWQLEDTQSHAWEAAVYLPSAAREHTVAGDNAGTKPAEPQTMQVLGLTLAKDRGTAPACRCPVGKA